MMFISFVFRGGQQMVVPTSLCEHIIPKSHKPINMFGSCETMNTFALPSAVLGAVQSIISHVTERFLIANLHVLILQKFSVELHLQLSA